MNMQVGLADQIYISSKIVKVIKDDGLLDNLFDENLDFLMVSKHNDELYFLVSVRIN